MSAEGKSALDEISERLKALKSLPVGESRDRLIANLFPKLIEFRMLENAQGLLELFSDLRAKELHTKALREIVQCRC